MYLRLRNNLSKNISIILSLGFVSAGGFGANKPISAEDIDLLTDNLLGGAQSSARGDRRTHVYKSDESEYNRMPVLGCKQSISFSGAAFRFPWHFGVAAYLQENYSEKLPKVCFIGASAGAMVSTLLACDVKIARDVMGIEVDSSDVYKPTLTTGGNFTFNNNGWLDRVYSKLQDKPTGVYFNIFDAMRTTTLANHENLLPIDSAEKATNRATFSLTNVTSWWPKNERINQFNTRDDLMEYGFASGHLPWMVDGEFYTTVNGQKYIDGGITDNQPVFKGIPTIKLYPYMDSIWGSTALSWLSLYGNTNMERNRGIYMDGYTFAKNEDEKRKHGIWEPLNTIT
jgi:hypothetical protein